jgi:hypothetical protein
MSNLIRAVRSLIVAAQSDTGANLYSAIEACEAEIALAEMLKVQHGISILCGPLTGTGCYMLSVHIVNDRGSLSGASVSIADENLRMATDKKLVMASYLEQLAAQLRG